MRGPMQVDMTMRHDNFSDRRGSKRLRRMQLKNID